MFDKKMLYIFRTANECVIFLKKLALLFRIFRSQGEIMNMIRNGKFNEVRVPRS